MSEPIANSALHPHLHAPAPDNPTNGSPPIPTAVINSPAHPLPRHFNPTIPKKRAYATPRCWYTMTPARAKEVLLAGYHGRIEYDVMFRWTRIAAQKAGAQGIESWGLEPEMKRFVIGYREGVKVQGLREWIRELAVFRRVHVDGAGWRVMHWRGDDEVED